MKAKNIVLAIFVMIALAITLGSALAVPADYLLEITNVKVNNVVVNELEDSSDLKPLQEIVVKVTVKNNDTEPIAGITGKLTTFLDQEFTSNTFNLGAGEIGELTFSGVVSLDEVEGLYPAEIKVTGEDWNQNNVEDVFNFNMKINQDLHDIIISNLTFDDNTLTCGQSTTLTIELSNIGNTDEDDVLITVEGGSIDLESQELTVLKNENLAYNQFFISENDLSNGQNVLTVTAHYWFDWIQRSKTVTISGTDCAVSIASASPSQGSVVVDKQATQEFSVDMNNPQNLALTYEWKVGNDVQPETTDTFVLDPTALGLSLGQHTVKVTVSGADPSLPIPKQWAVEVADNPAGFSVSEIVFADVELGADDQTKQVTIKNIGSSEQLTGVAVEFVGVASKYGAVFTDGLSVQEQTLDAGEPATVTIQLDVPEDEDGGAIGKLKVTGTDANSTPVVKEVTISIVP
ncbi:MAG: hypothetical protein AABX05_04870, partial [Nanoarchaeota archaeon]